MRSDRRGLTSIVALALIITACSGSDEPTNSTAATSAATSATSSDGDDQFPSVVQVATTYNGDGTFDFAVTMRSPYDTPERYADGWRVVGADGTEYGTHTLTHDHAGEQPFTRRQAAVEIADDVTEVIVEGRDLVNGFGGETQTVVLVREAGS
ncbi:MAG: hypothetical protein ABIP17_15745 [Ilumatobacteraceae bacterium]